MDPYRIGTMIETNQISIPKSFTRPNSLLKRDIFLSLIFFK